MGYQVRVRGNAWSLYAVTDPGGEGKREQKYISKKSPEFRRLGFRWEMSKEDAKAWAKSIGADRELIRLEERRRKLDERIRQEDLVECAWLPPDYVKEFELELKTRKLRKTHWNAAKRLIRKWGLDPKYWMRRASEFYSLLARKAYSPDYCSTLIRALNEWGDFFSEKKGSYFRAIPPPTGESINTIISAYRRYDGKAKRKRPSGRLSFKMLDEKKKLFKPEEYQYLWISIAFGLRPEEMDSSITDQTKHAVRRRKDKTYLFVYQWKLERAQFPPEKCWKRIDVLTEEQKKALAWIESGDFKRPRDLFDLKDNRGRRLTHYCGRKEFFPYMLKLGYPEEQVTRWLGHLRADTARRHYDDPSDFSPHSFDEDEEAA